jgi:hypothetical protein
MAFLIVVLFVMVCLLVVGWWKEVELTNELAGDNDMLKRDMRRMELDLGRVRQDRQAEIDYVESLIRERQVQDDGTTD